MDTTADVCVKGASELYLWSCTCRQQAGILRVGGELAGAGSTTSGTRPQGSA
jgi:hypothetical protein